MPATQSILEQVVATASDRMTPALAKYVLALGFPPKVQSRCAKLSKKANRGTLTEKERAELEELVNVNDFLMILQSQARASLKRRSPAA